MSRSIVETTEGLQDIVTSWLRDPCFDLVSVACDEGYQNYEKELSAYELQWKIKWDNEHLERLIKHADQFDPVARAFEMEKTRKAIATNTDKLFAVLGRNTMPYLK